MDEPRQPRVDCWFHCLYPICALCELLMSKWIVGVMMLVVIAMFVKGVEVLGPSNTNRDILYEGPKKTVKERWDAAYEWIKEKRENKSQ